MEASGQFHAPAIYTLEKYFREGLLQPQSRPERGEEKTFPKYLTGIEHW
jgi:hypothetical protein